MRDGEEVGSPRNRKHKENTITKDAEAIALELCKDLENAASKLREAVKAQDITSLREVETGVDAFSPRLEALLEELDPEGH